MSAQIDPQQFDPFAGPALAGVASTTDPQREIWTACQLGSDASLAYNESITLRLDGALDLDGFQQAFADLVARHEALRSTISADGLSIFIAEPAPISLPIVDLSALTPESQERELDRLGQEAVAKPFDLEKGPLFHASLLILGPQKHAVLFTAHHIVCDGWSIAVVLGDWARLYNARKHGFAAELEAAPSLADHAHFLETGDPAQRSQDEAYWVNLFNKQIPVFDLPSDRPRPAQKTFASRRRGATLPAELVTGVRQAGAKSRASLFATLFAAFNTLVFRLVGEQDLVVGVPVAGQSGTAFAGLVGHCVNMLPIRTKIAGNEAFGDLLGQVRTALLDAQDHQSLTFGALLTKLPIARDPSRLPLVNVIFNLDRGMTNETLGFDGLHASISTNARKFENFDLFLNAVELDGTVELECQYNTDLYDADTIDRWLASYRRLLQEIAADASHEVSRIPVLSERDTTLLTAWNQTGMDFRRDATVHALVKETVRRDPERPCLDWNGKLISYAELDRRAESIARHLVSRGVQAGGLVGLCLERSPDLIAAALGIWKAGAAYVPLDPDYPRERLAYMVADSRMSAVVTSQALQSELSLDAPVRLLVEEVDGAEAPSVELPPGSPDAVAYVIYTSGSTGKPKGVLVPHKAVVNLLTSVAVTPGVSREDAVLAVTTLSFDIAVSEIWLPLVQGARIVLATREIATDGGLLRRVVEERSVTFIDATPATYRLLLGAGWKPASNQTLICTGEAMPLDLARELLPHCGALWNGYGPTETTVWSTFWRVQPGFQKILIGRPVANTEIYILDQHRREVPVGVSGELYIGGDGVTLGYLQRPELTAERFLDDPNRPGYKLYRTGDLGRYLPDGNIECLGRNDHQVKLRGYRIELGEIEDALVRHPEVQQATVLLREDRPGDAKLVGYLVSRAAAPSPTELRAHLKTLLPDYMVPSVYVSLAQLPLTPSGKIDRKALPAPDASAAASQGAEFTAPASNTEQLLADIWAELLGVARVSVTDDFFALGGHSLLASQVLARLRRGHGIDLTFRKFFEAPTIRQLASVIDGLKPNAATAMKGIERRSGTGPVPLSISQERLFLMEEMHPVQRIVHNLPAAWELYGSVRLSSVQGAVDAMARRHETLRTTFTRIDGQLVQEVHPSVSLPVAFVDLRSFPAEQRNAEAHRQIQASNAEPFDLSRGPLFRSTLFQLEDEKFIYYTLRHSLIWDGWSFDVFVNELSKGYAACEKGEQPSLEALPISYADYVLWHAERLKSQALLDQQAWWRKRLEGAPKDLLLPLDRPRQATTTYAGSSTSVSLSRADANSLTAVAHANGTTLFMALFASYVAMLHRFSGQNDILVGLPVRGRLLPELEGLIGPFINTVVLRTELNPNDTFADYLKKVRDTSLEAFSHEEMPLEMLGDRPPVVRALFSYQDARARPVHVGDMPLKQIDVELGAASNDLMVWVVDRESELKMVTNYSSDVFDKETVQRILRSYLALIGAVIRDPSRKLAELPMLSLQDQEAAERVEHSGVSEAGLSGAAQRSPHELLVARAGARGATAFLDTQDRSIAWDAAPQQVATYASAFVGAGVTQGNVVGVLTSDPVEFALSTLAAWRIGATLLPLSADAPRELNLSLLKLAQARALYVGAKEDRSAFAGEACSLVSLEDTGASLPLPELSSAEALRLPACLRPTWNEEGRIELTTVTQGELVDAARGLAGLIGSASAATLRAAADLAPHADQGVLQLVLALTLGTTLTLGGTLSPEGFADALTRAERSASADELAAWAAPVGFDVALEGRASFPRLLALFGHGEASLQDELSRRAARVLVVRTANAALPGYFVREYSEGLPVALGRPLGGLSVVDPSGNQLPLGALGSIVQKGASPRGDELHGRFLSNGELQVREDDTRAWREGYSMHLAAPAKILREQGAVSDAFVRVESAGDGATRLVAYFSPDTNSARTDSELRRMLRQALPEALVPSVFVELPELPRGADGLVDASGLVSPFSKAGAAYVEPRTETEKVLASCYAEVLGTTRIGVYDNFFNLGGHSLLCLRVVHLLSERHKLVVNPRTLLLNTLEQAAAELDQRSKAVEAPLSGVTTKEPEGGLARSVLRGLSGLWKGRGGA